MQTDKGSEEVVVTLERREAKAFIDIGVAWLLPPEGCVSAPIERGLPKLRAALDVGAAPTPPASPEKVTKADIDRGKELDDEHGWSEGRPPCERCGGRKVLAICKDAGIDGPGPRATVPCPDCQPPDSEATLGVEVPEAAEKAAAAAIAKMQWSDEKRITPRASCSDAASVALAAALPHIEQAIRTEEREKVLAAVREAFLNTFAALGNQNTVNNWDFLAFVDKALASLPLDAMEEPCGKDAEDCKRCGRSGIVWFAESPLWNAVIRGGSINGAPKFGDMVCASCFMELAEEQGIASRFRVSAEVVNVELQTTTPSGRVWDEDRWLWTQPPDSLDRPGTPEDRREWTLYEVDDGPLRVTGPRIEEESLSVMAVADHEDAPCPELDRLRKQLGAFAQAMREGGWDRLAARVEQILRDEHGTTDADSLDRGGEAPKSFAELRDRFVDPEKEQLRAELKRFRDNCPHRDMTLNPGDGTMTCDLCGVTQADPFAASPAPDCTDQPAPKEEESADGN